MAPVLFLAGFLYVRSQLETTVLWSHTVTVVTGAPVLIGPIAAGVAAFTGARSRRRGTWQAERLSAGGVAGVALAEITALVLWAFAGYAALVAIMFATTAQRATWGGPAWLWTVTAGIGLSLHIPLGWGIGRLLPLRFTPFGVALILFALYVYVDNSVYQWWRRLSPAVAWVIGPFDEVVHLQLWGELSWYSGLAIAVFTVLAGTARARWRVIITLLAATTTPLALGLIMIGASGPSFATVTNRTVVWICEGESAQICVHPAFADSIPPLRRRLERVIYRLRDTPFAVRRAEHRPRGGPAGEPSIGAIPFGLSYPKAGNYDTAALELAVNALYFGPSCLQSDSEGPRPAGQDALMFLARWVADKPRSIMLPEEESDWAWLDSHSQADVARWMTAKAEKIRSCTLELSDFR